MIDYLSGKPFEIENTQRSDRISREKANREGIEIQLL